MLGKMNSAICVHEISKDFQNSIKLFKSIECLMSMLLKKIGIRYYLKSYLHFPGSILNRPYNVV